MQNHNSYDDNGIVIVINITIIIIIIIIQTHEDVT